MKYEITDRTIYQTIYWVVESENDVYYVRYNEDDSDSHWDIDSELLGQNKIQQIDPQIVDELIKYCQNNKK